MKKIILSISLLILVLTSKAQQVGKFHITEIPAEYIELVGTSKIFKPLQVNLTVNYGQAGTFKEIQASGGYALKNSDGSLYAVNGMMGALNLFAINGWELHSTMLLTVNNSNVYHYILREKSRR